MIADTTTGLAAVRMHPWERDIANGIAGQILRALRDKPRGHYMPGIDPTGPDAFRARAASILCEMAVAKYLNEFPNLGAWAAYVDHYDAADVGKNLEVRRSELERPTGLIIRRKDVAARRVVVLTHVRELVVVIFGAIEAGLGWHLGRPVEWSRDARSVPVSKLQTLDDARRRRALAS